MELEWKGGVGGVYMRVGMMGKKGEKRGGGSSACGRGVGWVFMDVPPGGREG